MNRGAARPNLFSVSIPRAINNQNFDANDYLRFFCKATAVPSISHQLVGANGHERVGVVRQQPTGIVYGKPFEMTVIERADFHVYNQMKAWFDRTSPGANVPTIIANHRLNYYDNFVCDIKLMKLEYSPDASDYDAVIGKVKQGKVTEGGYVKPLTVKFKNAYPTDIGQISLSSEIQNGYVEFTVKFNYEVFETTNKDTDNDE